MWPMYAEWMSIASWSSDTMADFIQITQIRSGIGRPQDQRRTLRGLGLTRMNKSVVLEDTECIRGMIRKIAYLVKVERPL